MSCIESKLKGGSKVARPTKANIIRCKRIKGGRAGCWIKEKGKTVFRMASTKYLSGLGITMTGGKMLPGFAGGSKKKRSGTKRTGCKMLKNGRRGCYTSKGFRIVS